MVKATERMCGFVFSLQWYRGKKPTRSPMQPAPRLRQFFVSALLALANTAPALAGTLAHPVSDGAWVPVWTAVPDSTGPALKAQTIRQVVRTSIAGSGVRLRLSNL